MTQTSACRPWTVALCVLLCALGRPAYAQQPVRDILSFLLISRAIQTGAPERDREAAEATRDTISQALLIELATLPIASSSGGFAYRFNPALGTVARASETFGPFFLERALTSGRKQASFGATYRYASFTKLDGRKLRSGAFVTTANKFRDEGAPFDVEALTLKIRADTVTLFGNVGVADRLDIGFAAPIVTLTLDGERINTYRGQSFVQARAATSTTGLADVAIRAKVHLLKAGAGGLAAGAEVRLPTGKAEDLLGTGKASTKALLIASAEGGRAAAHFNLAYTAGGISKEISYGGALTVAAASHLTLVGEAIVRRIDDLKRIREVTTRHPQIAGVDTIRLLPEESRTQTAVVLAGFKWNLARTWIVSGSLLVPLTDVGLTARVTPSVTLDYSFGR